MGGLLGAGAGKLLSIAETRRLSTLMQDAAHPEFDAVIGDLKASLDKLRIPDKEQKELLAIVESTRPLIVTER